MAMATLVSITGLAQTLTLENNGNNLRDVSFSSYLNTSEEAFVRKLAESSRNLGPNISVQEDDHHLRRKKEEDREIGVFSAEKYFNGVIDVDSSRSAYNIVAKKYQQRKDSQNCSVSMKPKIHLGNNGTGTPSIHSESSWNSQSALLQNSQQNMDRRKPNKAQGKSFLAGLACKCACSDKDSVDVDDEHVGEISFKKNPYSDVLQGRKVGKEHITSSILDSEHKLHLGSSSKQDSLGIGLNKENYFTFPTLKSAAGAPEKMQEELAPRRSLEVFGSPVQERRNKSLSFDKKLTKFPWEELEFSAKSCGVPNDNESEASSDLFEIESLTGKVAPFLARQGSGANSGCATPCYAPSEASIEWSVVTASAADFSVMSDYEELRPPITLPSPIKAFPAMAYQKTGTSKGSSLRLRPGILGCKSQKAVNVAGDAYRMNTRANYNAQMHRIADTYVPVARFKAATNLTGLESRPLATRSLPRPYTPQRSSHLLYI